MTDPANGSQRTRRFYSTLLRVTGVAALDGVTPIPANIPITTGPDGQRQMIVPGPIGVIDPGDLIGVLDDIVLLNATVVSKTAIDFHAPGSAIRIQSQTTPEVTISIEDTVISLSDSSIHQCVGIEVPRGSKVIIDTTPDGAAGPHFIQLDWATFSSYDHNRVIPLPLPTSGGGGGGGGATPRIDTFSGLAIPGPGPGAIGVLSFVPVNPASVILDLNGIVKQELVEYTLAGSSLTWIAGLALPIDPADVIQVHYQS